MLPEALEPHFLDFLTIIAVARSRCTIPSSKDETVISKLIWSLVIASPMAIKFFFTGSETSVSIPLERTFLSMSCLHLFSYAVQFFANGTIARFSGLELKGSPGSTGMKSIPVLIGLFLSLLALQSVQKILFSVVCALLPINELTAAHGIISEYLRRSSEVNGESHAISANGEILRLLIITFHLQIATGFIGIRYVEESQRRKNELIVVKSSSQNGISENEARKSSRSFCKLAFFFIIYSALPYLIQRTFFDNLNRFAIALVKNRVHMSVRLDALFEHDSQMYLMTQGINSALSPEAYAKYMDTVVQTATDLVSRKCFSLPKILLLPGIVMKQPLLMAQIFPVTLLVDNLKNRLLAKFTMEIEKTSKEKTEIEGKRSRIEQYDMKYSGTLRNSGREALEFTRLRWHELTDSIQKLDTKADILNMVSRYLRALYWLDILGPLTECSIAQMIAAGQVMASEIMVYSRSIQDTLDFVLMRSRAEAELASLDTAVKNLEDYLKYWDETKRRLFVPCSLGDYFSISDLSYRRGSASVAVKDMSLDTGVYALTGGNGSGKSTLLQLLVACSTNIRPIDLPSSIAVNASEHSIVLPTNDIVIMNQNIYWPIHTKPIDWILHQHVRGEITHTKNIMDHLQSLNFYSDSGPLHNSTSFMKEELLSDKEDWFSELSGGQKAKVELVRLVFQRNRCPGILLLDETFAPLDPQSKKLAMSKLKAFCPNSVVIVIFHSDKRAGYEGDCVPSYGFFDHNLHVNIKGELLMRNLC